ncbi:T9SS type A sorting domain-containing protein [Mangrovimonas spongiae]|uniref:T9SS C-terminal target domain-containing protein n=1 Tax=Mangrovimonas spongiae TaxID=2494697 RepID=A0A3R9ME66_9FLAO|nr:T9SS type A sorting domain-containing protein [Mangrovimonas spongiae]RSK38282.1 T9SS C-terminal target domain-containing protein [Mangrovimonas spongiae]
MKKTTFYLLVLCCVAFSWQSMSQCDFDGNQYPADPLILFNDGSVEEISDCNWFGEYSAIQNLNIGDEYLFDADGGYITIIDSADGTTVLAYGASPLTWTATATNVEAHWAVSAGCEAQGDFTCHITTITNNDGAPAPAPDCATTPTPAVGATDVTVGNTTLSWMAPTTGPTPTAYNIYEYDDEFGTNPGLIGTVTTTSMDVTINAYEVTLYWAAIPVNASTEATGCDVWSFTTEATPPPPANDDPAGAIMLTPGPDFATNALAGQTNGGATASEVADATIPDPSCSSYEGGDIWYMVSVPSDGNLTIETNADPTGGGGDSGMSIYSGAIGSFTEVGCNDDGSDDGLYSLVDIVPADGLADQTLYIRVFEYGDNATINFQVSAYSATLSVGQVEFVGFKYYPNPVNDMLSLKAQSNISKVSVYNMLGQEVIRTAPNTVSNDVNMSELQAGAYFVKVTVNGTTETIRIIKK